MSNLKKRKKWLTEEDVHSPEGDQAKEPSEAQQKESTGIRQLEAVYVYEVPKAEKHR